MLKCIKIRSCDTKLVQVKNLQIDTCFIFHGLWINIWYTSVWLALNMLHEQDYSLQQSVLPYRVIDFIQMVEPRSTDQRAFWSLLVTAQDLRSTSPSVLPSTAL